MQAAPDGIHAADLLRLHPGRVVEIRVTIHHGHSSKANAGVVKFYLGHAQTYNMTANIPNGSTPLCQIPDMTFINIVCNSFNDSLNPRMSLPICGLVMA
jgi:hypothetical protein